MYAGTPGVQVRGCAQGDPASPAAAQTMNGAVRRTLLAEHGDGATLDVYVDDRTMVHTDWAGLAQARAISEVGGARLAASSQCIHEVAVQGAAQRAAVANLRSFAAPNAS